MIRTNDKNLLDSFKTNLPDGFLRLPGFYARQEWQIISRRMRRQDNGLSQAFQGNGRL